MTTDDGCHNHVGQFPSTSVYADPLYGQGPNYGSGFKPLIRLDLGDFGPRPADVAQPGAGGRLAADSNLTAPPPRLWPVGGKCCACPEFFNAHA